MERQTQSKEFEGAHEIGKNISQFVENEIRPFGLDENESYEILLATDEAVANIIDHAYLGKGGKVEISINKEDDNLIIKIHDHAKKHFDPEGVKKFKIEEKLENVGNRGAGVHLMRSVMDSVNYEFTPEGNTVTMVKKLISESLLINVEESSKDRRGDLAMKLTELLSEMAKEKQIEGYENLTPASFTVNAIYTTGEHALKGERIIIDGIQSDHEGNVFVDESRGEVFKWDKDGSNWVKIKNREDLWDYAGPYLTRKTEFLTPKIKEEQK